MALISKDGTKLFIYSDMYINNMKSINKKIGRNFKCGQVSVGSDRKDYCNIIDANKLSSVMKQYPDTKVVYSVPKLQQAQYTEIDESFITY